MLLRWIPAAAGVAIVVVRGHCDKDELRCKVEVVVVCLRCERGVRIEFVVRDIAFFGRLRVHKIELDSLDVVCKKRRTRRTRWAVKYSI